MTSTAFPTRVASMARHLSLFARLARAPHAGADEVLREGTLGVGAAAVAVACGTAALSVARFAGSTAVSDLIYGPQRSPLVGTLLDMIGTARTAVVVYLLEQAWNAVLVVAASGPLFVWLLGATAVHAAARLAGVGRPFARLNVFAAYATAVALVPAGLVSLALESDARSTPAAIGRLLGFALLVWLGSLFYRGIRAYYGVAPSRALTILVTALTLFYVVPLLAIAGAVVAIVVAAVALELA